MDRYQRVEKPKPESPIQENEIRITTQGLIRNYLSYGISLIQDKHAKEINLKAMGQAISKSVAIAEYLKKQIPNLHQDTVISSVSLTDVWEPLEEGLVPVETTRTVSMISITLARNELNKTSPGYQAPSYIEESKHQHPWQARGSYNAGYGDSYGRGRGRGRGRGWGRGHGDYYQDNNGYYNNYGPGHRGRGRNFYRGDDFNRVSYDQGYDQGHEEGYDQSRGGGYERGQGDGYEHGRRGGGYERGGRGGGYERGGRGGYDRGQGGGYERARAGGYERGRGGGGYDRDQGGGYERGQGGYPRGRGGVYEQGQAGGYEGGQGGGYERGRGGHGRGRAGGRSRGGGY
ncbi:unnamed protein product [Rhodiola kirilowii]